MIGVREDAGGFGQEVLSGQILNGWHFSAALTTLFRALMSVVLEFPYNREMLLVERGEDGLTQVSSLQPPQEV